MQDVDLAMNDLSQVPEALFKLKNLRKLDLSHNKVFISLVAFISFQLQIAKITLSDGVWESVETLNLSSNQLLALPDGLVRMTRLQKLYASDNRLTFDGAFSSRLPMPSFRHPEWHREIDSSASALFIP
jgi:Leucine-rich repeat (LRR) protein